MQWTRRCQWLAVSLLLGCLVLIEQAYVGSGRLAPSFPCSSCWQPCWALGCSSPGREGGSVRRREAFRRGEPGSNCPPQRKQAMSDAWKDCCTR
jgi:hypothetical protein